MSRMARLVEQVTGLSKEKLDSEARRLHGVLRLTTAELLAHLAEIDRRRLPMEWGYSGIFEYCREGLGMSRAVAALRLQVVRVCRRFPQLLDRIADGRIRLSVAGRLAPVLTTVNVDQVLRDCEGMGRKQVDEYLVRFRPRDVVDSGIRKAPEPRAGSGASADEPSAAAQAEYDRRKDLGSTGTIFGESGLDSGAESTTEDTSSRADAAPSFGTKHPEPHRNDGENLNSPSSGERGETSARSRSSTVEPARPGVFNVRFATSRELKEKIERLGEVLGMANPEKNLEQLFEIAVEVTLEQKDPKRRQARRDARAARKREREAARTRGEASEPDRSEREPSRPVRLDELAAGDSGASEAATSEGSGVLSRRGNAPVDRVRLDELEDGLGCGSGTAVPGSWTESVQPWGSTIAGDRARLDGLRERRRYVPAALRDAVLAKAGYRCEFVATSGRRCNETVRLEIDHVQPFGKNGLTEAGNLRCLCRQHNRWEAERHYGVEFMNQKIRQSRAK